MKLLVISDLHLSNNDRFGVFGWEQDDFLAKLDMVCTMYGVDKIILNGDIFELCRYDYRDIAQSNARLLGYLTANKAVFLRGNHDFSAPTGLDHYDIVNKNGHRIHIEHGHRADFFGGTKAGRFLSNAFLRTVKWLVGLSPVHALYFGALHREEEILRPLDYNLYDYLRYALKLHKKYDVVILGHTHKTEAHQTYQMSSPKLYLNSGTCTFGRLQGIVLDTESLLYEIIRFQASDVIAPLRKRRRHARPSGRPLPERVAANPG